MSVAGCSKEYIRYCSSLISIIITLTDYLSSFVFTFQLYSTLIYSTLLREAAVSFTGPRFDNRSSKEYFEEECFCPDAVEKVVNHHTLSLFLQKFSAFLYFYYCTSTTFIYRLLLPLFILTLDSFSISAASPFLDSL